MLLSNVWAAESIKLSQYKEQFWIKHKKLKNIKFWDQKPEDSLM